jgi:hypothetical protein
VKDAVDAVGVVRTSLDVRRPRATSVDPDRLKDVEIAGGIAVLVGT